MCSIPLASYHAYTQEDIKMYSNANDVIRDLYDFYNMFRSIMKHEDVNEDNYNDILEKLYKEFNDLFYDKISS